MRRRCATASTFECDEVHARWSGERPRGWDAAPLEVEVSTIGGAAWAAARPPIHFSYYEAPVASADAGRLWVDKYAPRAFRELLSEDRFNRQVLRWIKQWDPHVFGVQRPPAIWRVAADKRQVGAVCVCLRKREIDSTIA